MPGEPNLHLPFPRNVVVLGAADAGDYLSPKLIRSEAQAKELFTSGELVDQFAAAASREFGLEGLWMIRLNQDGEDLSDQQRYDRVEKAFELISGMPFHVVVPLSLPFDHDTLDIASLILEFLESQSHYTRCLGILETKALSEAEDVDALANHERLESIQSREAYRLILVSGSAYVNFNTSSSRLASPAVAVAGLIGSMDFGQTATYKPLLHLRSLKKDWTYDQRKTLEEAGISVLTKSNRKGLVLHRAVTASQDNLHDLGHVMIAEATIDFVMRESWDYIGEPVSLTTTLEGSLQDFLDEKRRQGWIRGSSVSLTKEGTDSLLVNVEIEVKSEVLTIQVPVNLEGVPQIG